MEYVFCIETFLLSEYNLSKTRNSTVYIRNIVSPFGNYNTVELTKNTIELEN